MAEKLGEALLELGTDDKAFDKGVDRAEGRAKALGRKLDEAGQRARRLGRNLTLGVTTPLAALGATSIRAFQVQERAIAKVEAALEATGGTVGLTSKQLQAMASELQQVSTFGDEDILENLTAGLLKFTNLTGNEFVQAQKLAIDMAAQTGQSLSTVARQLGLALESPADGLTLLRRSGVVFSEATEESIKSLAEQGKMAEAQALLFEGVAARFGGAAEKLAQTSEGQLTQVRNLWGDIQEQFGEIAAEVLPPLLSGLRNMLTWLQNLSPETKRWVVGLGAAAAAIGPLLAVLGLFASGLAALVPVIATVGTALSAAFVLATGPVGLAIAAVAGLTAIWITWGDDITRIVEATVTAVQTWLVDRFSAIVDGVKGKVDAVVGFFAGMYETVVGNSIVPDMIDEIGVEFGRLGSEMVGKVATATDQVTGQFEQMDEVSRSILSSIKGALKNFITEGEFDFKNFLGSLMSGVGGSLFDTGFSALTGYANGGSFEVGGVGGTDNNLVAFRATRGERVDITPAAVAARGGASSQSRPNGMSVMRVELSKDLTARILQQAENQSVEISNSAIGTYRDTQLAGDVRASVNDPRAT